MLMRTDEELMQDLMNYMNNLATLSPTNQGRCILTGHQVNVIGETMAREYVGTLGIILPQLAQQIENAFKHGVYQENQTEATKGFQYVFDRTLESFYLTYTEQNTDSVSYDLNEVGDYYELSLPTDFQMMVNLIVPKIVGIAGELYTYMKDNQYMELPVSKWMHFYMLASSSLAMKYVMEQEL